LDIRNIPSKEFLVPASRRGLTGGAEHDSDDDYAGLLEVIQSEEAKEASRRAAENDEEAGRALQEVAEAARPPSQRVDTEPESASLDEDHEERDYVEPVFKWTL
jgi:hypothetical protein